MAAPCRAGLERLEIDTAALLIIKIYIKNKERRESRKESQNNFWRSDKLLFSESLRPLFDDDLLTYIYFYF